MFAITKLGPMSQAFIAEMSMNNKSRSAQSSLALAKALTFCAALPSSPVDDTVAFYRTHVQFDIECKLNGMNELLVLDVKVVLDYCLKFWQLRYQSAHPTCHVFSFNKESGVEDFFGISRVFDKATIAIVKDDPAALAVFINKFKGMLDELFTAPARSEEVRSSMDSIAGVAA